MDKAYKSLLELQGLQFAFIEMKLYLDTHPYDATVQRDLMHISKQISMLMPKVEKYFGPLKGHDFSKQNPIRWITDPWPWELMY